MIYVRFHHVKVWHPLLEVDNKLGSLGLELILLPTKATAKRVIWTATKHPDTFRTV